MCRAILQKLEYIAQNVIQIAAGKLGVSGAARQCVVEINIQEKLPVRISGRHDAKTGSKFGWVKVQLGMTTCSKSEGFGDGIERVLKRPENDQIICVGRHRLRHGHPQ